jgi:hypothetical protein
MKMEKDRSERMRDLKGIRFFNFLLAGLIVIGLGTSILPAQEKSDGFTDTPYLPDGKWRVHDANRPTPPKVTPGEEPGEPPSDAVVLFDGRDLSNWRGERNGESIEPGWKVENGYMEIVPRSGSLISKQKFGDCQIHLEWASPSEVQGNGQGRGNSGVLIMGFYEIQVLDSYNNLTYADGQAGAMYGQYPPLVNAAKKPGEWQTYDIIFEAPRFEGETLMKPAYVTVIHNGVVLHHRQAFIGRVVWRQLAKYSPHDATGPLLLQDHGNPVRYRNIWVRPLGEYPGE